MTSLVNKLMTSERVIDTSALQSTKNLGRVKQRPLDENRLLDKISDTLEAEAEEVTSNYSQDDNHDESSATLQPMSTASPIAPIALLGTALKKADTVATVEVNPRKRKRQEKMSWRERLELSRKKPAEDQSSQSEMSESSSEEEEEDFSDWNGLSGDDEDDGGEDLPEQNGEYPLDSAQTNGSSISDVSSDSEDEQLRQRAGEFKNWAREQSGLGPSVSNISSLPPIPPRLSHPEKAVNRDHVPQPEPAERKQVMHKYEMTDLRHILYA